MRSRCGKPGRGVPAPTGMFGLPSRPSRSTKVYVSVKGSGRIDCPLSAGAPNGPGHPQRVQQPLARCEMHESFDTRLDLDRAHPNSATLLCCKVRLRRPMPLERNFGRHRPAPRRPAGLTGPFRDSGSHEYVRRARSRSMDTRVDGMCWPEPEWAARDIRSQHDFADRGDAD